MSDGITKLTEINSISDTRYIGSTCSKHPDLLGERRKKNHQCVQCWRDSVARRKARPEVREKINEARREAYTAGRIAADIEKKAHDRVRIEACNIAIRQVQDGSRWREFWSEAMAKTREATP